MCAKKTSREIHNEILSYTYPKLYKGKDWFVGFKAFDPASGQLKIKRIRINHIGTAMLKNRYANVLIKRISRQLDDGWNPWIENHNSRSYHGVKDVLTRYKNYLTKKYNDGIMREKTMVDYLSRLRILMTYIDEMKKPIVYIYQFDRFFVSDFLDYIYLERENSPRTRNNYLIWLCTLSSWLVEKMYLDKSPTNDIPKIRNSKGRAKDRDVIPNKEMEKLHHYLTATNKYFLLACYFVHYVLIRPKEMSYIKIQDISLKHKTLFISGDISKNRKDAVVTLPKKVIHLLLELDVFRYPGNDFLFSTAFKPGSVRKHEKQFRDYWARTVRPTLGWGNRYKFYSLKDTGITNMLRHCDVVSVRDQARHSSILITDMYTPADISAANKILLDYDGVL